MANGFQSRCSGCGCDNGLVRVSNVTMCEKCVRKQYNKLRNERTYVGHGNSQARRSDIDEELLVCVEQDDITYHLHRS